MSLTMSTGFHLFRSLFLTVVVSFLAPITVVGILLASLSIGSYIPGIENFSQAGGVEIFKFLEIFGSGNPLEGIVVIGGTCGIVGGLFDLCTLYRYQNFGEN